MSANPPADARAVSDPEARADAEREGQPFLLFTDGGGRERRFVLPPDAHQVSVGRRPESDLVLDWDDQVSRLHARFERAGDGWELVDDGFSSNGTFVNGKRLHGRCRLNDGDSLRLGTTKVTFRAPEPAPPQPPTPEPVPPQPPTPEPAPPQRPPAHIELSTTQRRVLVALCRPSKGRSGFASPASDQQIAEELYMSVREVNSHLAVLAAKLGAGPLPDQELRVALVERAIATGLIPE